MREMEIINQKAIESPKRGTGTVVPWERTAVLVICYFGTNHLKT